MSRKRKKKKNRKSQPKKIENRDHGGDIEPRVRNKLVIGCDIGGVIRDMNSSDEEGLKLPVPDSIKFINRLNRRHKVILISKAKNEFVEKSNRWLKKYELSHLSLFFCREDADKIVIAKNKELNLDFMIDDTLPVLKTFVDANYPCTKIWFVWKWRDNPKYLRDTEFHHKELLDQFRIAHSWKDVGEIIHSLVDKEE